VAADTSDPTPPSQRKARPVTPPPVPAPDPEVTDGPPPPERRQAPGRGGSSSRDVDRPVRRAPDAPRGARSTSPRTGATPGRSSDAARQTRRSTPSTPGGARGKPVGAERAQRRPDAPARRPAPKATAAAPKPALPDGEQAHLPKAVRRDLERTLGPGRRSDEVALALSIGSQAIDEGLLPVALEHLAWAKDQAPRVAAIREALGVARYLAEDYAAALTELQAYARISGRNDQNHLVADCLRALGRDVDRVEAAARALLDDDRAPADRRAEAAIVLAGALGDAGRPQDGLDVLAPVLTERRQRDLDHHLRVRSLVADLALAVGDRDAARRQLEVLLATDDDGSFDARERLDAIEA
jgi:hypothetical protein